MPSVIESAGVDTWSLCWYLSDESAPCKAIEELATEPAARSKLLPDEVAGHRVGWFPGSRMLFAEGHPGGDGLCKGSDLEPAFSALLEGLRDRGVMPESRTVTLPRKLYDGGRLHHGIGFGGVRRLDSTVDLAFQDPLEGLAVLGGVAALPMPRMKTKLMREAGGRRVETVWFHGHGGKRVLGRWYDKGIESGGAARGNWVRPEDQRRYSVGSRLPLEAVASASFVRDAFVKRFEPLWKAAKGVTVGGAIKLAEKLGQLQEEGVITAGEAKRIAGHLLLDTADAHRQARSTVLGDRAAARKLGLVLADGVVDEVEVELDQVIERALDSSAWGAQG